jgi:hypothetical protein
MFARRFLYVIAILIGLLLVAGIGWSLFQDRLMRMAFVPSVPFAAMSDATAPDYARPAAWLARPGLRDNPSQYGPPGFGPTTTPRAAIFYIPPTTHLAKDRWNAPIDDKDANERLALFARSQASAFNAIGAIWAPRYRQATLGAFLVATDPRSIQAIDFAYRDVAHAFDAFLAANPVGPIVLAAHSQGSLHLLRLLREKVAGRPLARRIAAVYAIGWPISVTADLPALGLPACSKAREAHCILAWQSFADPADPRLIDAYFDATTGYAGLPRKGTKMLCVNPINGERDGKAGRLSNWGSLVPHADFRGADLKDGVIGALCSPQGLLLIGDPPTGFDRYVLPGNNYHVFDYALFWGSIRKDAEERVTTMLTEKFGPLIMPAPRSPKPS